MRRTAASVPPLPDLHMLRLRMRRVLKLTNTHPGALLLQQHMPQLTRSLLSLRRDLRSMQGMHLHCRRMRRLLPLARQAGQHLHSHANLTDFLRTASLPIRERERSVFPLLVRFSLADDLDAVLAEMLADQSDRRHAQRILRRLSRTRQPLQLLSSMQMTCCTVNALLILLKDHPHPAVSSTLEEYLTNTLHLTHADIVRRVAQNESRQADLITRLIASFEHADQLHWPTLLEEVNPLHMLLSQDAVYSTMTLESRTLYRRQAGHLACLFRIPEVDVVQAALNLAHDTQKDHTESHIGWYLLDPAGQSELRCALHTHHGRWHLLLDRHQNTVLRLFITALDICASLLFLHAGYSLWILPVFLAVFHHLIHVLHRRFMPSPALPCLHLDQLSDQMRTLIVLPAVLSSSHDAIRAARQLLTLRQSLAGSGMDCLLLGDWGPCMTQRSSEDASVIQAATLAIQALNDNTGDDTHYYFLQRSRTWDGRDRIYTARGGRFGALESLCQMMCRGDFFDGCDAISFPAENLQQRYAWILTAGIHTRPEPNLLLQMAGTLAHPLNMRRHTHRGTRGYSFLTAKACPFPTEQPSRLQRFSTVMRQRDTVMLIRPGDLLDDTEDILDTASNTAIPSLWQALAGHDTVGSAFEPRIPDVNSTLLAAHDRCRDLFAVLPWQFTHVRTPHGILRNPLSSSARYRLRRSLSDALIPLSQIILLIAATLHHDIFLFLLTLTIPLLMHPTLDALMQLAMLPTQACSLVNASLRGLLSLFFPGRSIRELRPERVSTIELWSQSILAALLIWLTVLGEGMFLPGFALAAIFASFPFLHAWMDDIDSPDQNLSAADEQLLQEIAASTWRYFQQTVTDETHRLPPDFYQLQPAAHLSHTTSPRSIALYSLSCIAALEMELISPSSCAKLLQGMLSSLDRLTRPHGLLLARYHLDSLQPEKDSLIPSADNGLLCAALLTCAQCLRAHLQSLSEEFHSLPTLLDYFARSMDLISLYNKQTGLFFTHLDPEKSEQDAPSLSLFADEGLVLSFVAVMRHEVPADHLSRLYTSRVRLGRSTPMLTLHGSMESLLPTLLLPSSSETFLGRTAHSFAQIQHRSSHEGLIGQGACACYAFDSHLQYAEAVFGLSEIALQPASAQPVYSPWASALMLPFTPSAALGSLRRMKSLGLMTHQGFLESIDFTSERLPEESEYALVHLYTTLHQGIILCSAAHMLTHHALSRHFMSLPAADASSLLLREYERPLLLPASTRYPQPQIHREPSWKRSARLHTSPVDAHMLGSRNACILLNSAGSNVMRFHGINATSFTASAGEPEGLQICLSCQGQTFRLQDPSLPGSTVYGEGYAKFVRQCGAFTCVLTILCDPSADAIIHTVDVLNNHDRELSAELSDRMTISQDAPATVFDARSLLISLDDHTLLHSVYTDDASSVSVHSAPIALHTKLNIPARSQRTVTFVTRIDSDTHPIYTPADSSTLLTIARLHARTLTDSLSLSQKQAEGLSTLLGALLWQGQLHQGTDVPLTSCHCCPLPTLTVQIFSEDGFTLLLQAAALIRWVRLTGLDATLCVLCPEEWRDAVEEQLPSDLFAQILSEPPENDLLALLAVSRLVLQEGAGTAEEQLSRLITPLPSDKLPQPDYDPWEESTSGLYNSGLSCFDAQTGDCHLKLSPDHLPPRSWQYTLHSNRFSTSVSHSHIAASDASGPITAWEHILLTDLDEHTRCSLTPQPCGDQLHWKILFSPGIVTWNTAFSSLNLTLTAACMPRHTCGIRTLRIKNTSRQERKLMLHISTAFSLFNDPASIALTPIGSSILAQHPLSSGSGFLSLAEGETRTFACTPLGCCLQAAQPYIPTANGSIGVLEVTLAVPAGSSTNITWLTGYVPQADDLELILRRIQRSGASAVFRSVRQQWLQRRSALTFHTPEESLNLLLNHWLPAQFLLSGAPLAAPACTMLELDAARPQLLLHARDHTADTLLPWLTAAYVRLSGDAAALNDLVPHDAHHPSDPRDTLYARCISALLAPVSDLESTLVCILGIHALLPWMDAPDAQELRQRADTLKESVTDIPIHARLASLAVLALGSTPAATFALRESFLRLFDPALGILRRDESPDSPQDTLSAVWMLCALAHLGWSDYAWTLLRALNPIHHTDDPMRTAEYGGEPWLIPASVSADGQAGHSPSPGAAGLLYAVIVENLLGLQRQANEITLRPLLPAEWDSCSLTLRFGVSQWHIDFSSHGTSAVFTLTDDGQTHHISTPLHIRQDVFAP